MWLWVAVVFFVLIDSYSLVLCVVFVVGRCAVFAFVV